MTRSTHLCPWLLAVVLGPVAGCPWQPARPAENVSPADAAAPDLPAEGNPKGPTATAKAVPPAVPGQAAWDAPEATEATDAGLPVTEAEAQRQTQRRVVERALAYDPADPLANLEAADALSAQGNQGAFPDLTGPCQWVSRPRRLWPQPAQLAVTAAANTFVVGGYATSGASGASGGAGDLLFVLRVEGEGLPKLLHTSAIAPAHPGARLSPPGLAARDVASVTVAMTDGAGALKVAEVATSGPRANTRFESVAGGVDTRFAPAVAHLDAGTLIAFTKGTTPMQTHVALLRHKAGPPQVTNITPGHVGATAPAFSKGESPPRLYMVDARDGMSPILASKVAADGTVSQAEVVVPVGMVTSPTRLAVARAAFGTALAYVGVGAAATTAIGIIDVAPKPGSPSPMIPGTAYGPLAVAAAAAPDAIYFAADAPTERGNKHPKRAIDIVRLGAGGKQVRTRLVGGAGDAYGVAIARSRDGLLGLAFNQPDAAYFARLRCR